MKKLIFLFLLLNSTSIFAQNSIYTTNAGEITFFSKAPLEDIEAKNEKVTSLINTANNQIVVRAPIRQFEFRNKLMQEHFNENYLESERYPHATFKGQINEKIDFQKPGSYDVSATGTLNIHGVNQKRTLNGKLLITENSMQLTTTFKVMLVDHKIKIPKLVFNKIAEVVDVTTTFNYTLLKK